MTIRPPAVHSRLPIRRLAGPLAAKVEARQAAGLDTGYPRRRLVGRVVLPLGVLGVADLPVFITSTLTAHSAGGGVLAAVSGGVLVVAAGVATAAGRFVLRDPLRLTGSERRALNDARQWQSAQPWLGPTAAGLPGGLTASAERALLDAAVDAVTRIVASPSWRSSYLAEHRQRLDPAAELDQIDEQAYRLAELGASSAGRPGGDSAALDSAALDSAAAGAARAAVIQRVQALRGYADRLATLDDQLDQAGALHRSSARIDALLAGSATDEFAVDQVRSMIAELDYLSRAIADADGSAPGGGHSPDR